MTSRLRAPRSVVKVNGQPMGGWLEWSWEANSLFQADTFSCAFAMSRLPDGFKADWWAAQTSIDVEFLVGFPQDPAAYSASDLTSVFAGRVDDPAFDWDRGVISVSGRDLTAAFLDNKTAEKFPNQTASQIATTLAGRRGLTPVVTATKTKVGRFYQIDKVRMESDRTEWDLLTYLAREEGFIVYVQGKELHFAPRPTDDAGAYQVVWTPAAAGAPPSADHLRIRTSRSLTVAKDLVVIVRTWNAKSKKAFTRKATRNRAHGGTPQQYVYTIPGLTAEQAQQRANDLLAELTRHEMKLSFEGPAENGLGKAQMIKLSGTGTAFDQTYYPDTISRTFSVSDGYRWSVSAKNHSPESEPNL